MIAKRNCGPEPGSPSARSRPAKASERTFQTCAGRLDRSEAPGVMCVAPSSTIRERSGKSARIKEKLVSCEAVARQGSKAFGHEKTPWRLFVAFPVCAAHGIGCPHGLGLTVGSRLIRARRPNGLWIDSKFPIDDIGRDGSSG